MCVIMEERANSREKWLPFSHATLSPGQPVLISCSHGRLQVRHLLVFCFYKVVGLTKV